MVQSGVNMLGGGWVSVDAYVEPTPEDHRAEAKRWQQRASEEGVHCVFKSENFREPLSDAIVEYVRSLDEASVLISMISHTGNMQAAILGSVTRDVIRQSPCPVYIAGRSYERIGL
jgi:nucleotide-binding universal stress UspA family protein